MPPTPGLPLPPPHPSTSKRPPATPITAGAFSFSLPSSTPKRPRLEGPSHTPLRHSHLSTSSDRPASSRTAVTPQRAVHSLNALPSPFGFPPITPAPKSHKKLTAIFDKQSPFITSKTDDQIEDSDRVPLGQLPPSRIEDIPRERVKREEEGIGVSPRKTKGLKWTGKGPPPPSLQLANLLSSTNSSLLLFYSSLQRTLHPPPTSQKRGHIWSASLVLRPLDLVATRTHHGIFLRCLMISEKGSELGTDTDENDPFSTTSKTANGQQSAGQMILINLQPVPHECPRLGVDPKVMVGKMQEGTEKTWEIGVWAPFQSTELCDRPEAASEIRCLSHTQHPDRLVDTIPRQVCDNENGQPGPEAVSTAIVPNPICPSTTRAIFASRFLIAETT